MSPRLLSFLSDIETALTAAEPAPHGGTWQSMRTVNNYLGLGRLYLSTRYNAERLEPAGAVQLQSHRLADGSLCLKAFLTWSGRKAETVHAIYDQPHLDWGAEARRLAAAWLSGHERTDAVEGVYESLAAAI